MYKFLENRGEILNREKMHHGLREGWMPLCVCILIESIQSFLESLVDADLFSKKGDGFASSALTYV